MNVLKKGLSLVLITMMAFSPLTVFAQGDVSPGNTDSTESPQTTVSIPTAQEAPATTVETPDPTIENTAPVSPDTEALPQLTPEEATPTTADDAELEAQLVSTDGQFRYKQYGEENDLRVIVTEYLGDGPDIVVPATLDGKKVVEVDAFASYGKYDTIKSITVAEGISNLTAYPTSYSFSEYTNLQTLKLPSTLETTQLTLNGAKLTSLQAPTVSKLYLSVSNASADLSYLKNLTNLSDLTLSLDNALATTNANILKNLSNLTKLSISISGTDSIDSLSTLKNSQAFTNLSVSYSDGLTNLTPLKGLTNLTSLSLSNLKNVSDFSAIGSLTNLKGLTLTTLPKLSSLSNIAPCTQLTNLNLDYNKNLTTLSGLAGMTNLNSLSCRNCTNLNNIDAIKGLKSLSSIYLDSTQISEAEAATLFRAPQDITLYPGQSQMISVSPYIYIGTSGYSTINPELIAETPSIVTIDSRTITGNQAGTTKVQLQYDGKNIGKSFNVTYIDAVPDPNQPVDEPVNTLPTLTTISSTMTGNNLYGQYSDNSLWYLSNETPEKVMDNAKYLGAYVYKRGSYLSWQFITDTQDTLWCYETTMDAEGQPSSTLNKRVENAVDTVALNFSSIEQPQLLAYTLDTQGQVWQLKETGNILSPQTQKIDTDVKQLIKNYDLIGYLKNNGDLYVKYNSQYNTKKGLIKIASGVKDIINSKYYRSSDDKVYSINGQFVDTDKSGDDDEWQIVSSKVDTLNSFYGSQSYYVMSDNTTATAKYINGTTQYTTLFNFPITDAVSGRSVIPEGQTYATEWYDLVTDGKGGLWEINTSTNVTKKIADSFSSFDRDYSPTSYLLSNGDYYSVNHVLIDTNVKQVQSRYININYQTYILKDDGIVYFNDIPLLDQVGEINNYNGIYFTRTDGTIWTMPTSGELTPYKVYDYLGNTLLLGDTNDDGLINASDALQDLRHSVKEIELTGDEFTRGDVNKDETINASDALQILRYSVKEITEF